MAVERIHLRKLLKLLFLEPRELRSALRTDIREDIAREAGGDSGGGDFYAPFWADARQHVFGRGDLHDMVEQRIAANPESRTNLYPLLRNGFLLWWNERRRWTNQPFTEGRWLRTEFPFPGLDALVKVKSILSVTDALGAERLVYPYFAPDPVLSEHAARLGLWLLATALPDVSAGEFRILDVIRGRTFSLDRTPLQGDEEGNFRSRYIELVRLRDDLRREYD
jgi:hypothetical protein